MRKIINTPHAPGAIGPYSQGVVYEGNRTLYVSGQLPIDPTTGEMVTDGIEAETHQVIKNLQAIIEAAGGSLDNILKATILLTDMANFAVVNEVYGSYFPQTSQPPARICYQVSALPKGANVEIDAVCGL